MSNIFEDPTLKEKAGDFGKSAVEVVSGYSLEEAEKLLISKIRDFFLTLPLGQTLL
jgi:hypothetical protein